MLLIAKATAAVEATASPTPSMATLLEIGSRVQFTSVRDMLHCLRSKVQAKEYRTLLKQIVPCKPEAQLICPLVVWFLTGSCYVWEQIMIDTTSHLSGNLIVMILAFIARIYWKNNRIGKPVMSSLSDDDVNTILVT